MITLYQNDTQIPFKQWKFPGGEVGVQLPSIEPSSKFVVRMDYENSDDIFVFLNVCDALIRMGVDRSNIDGLIPYLPYARQDRVCNKGESFALFVFFSVIKDACIGKLETYDIHSQVSEYWFRTESRYNLVNKEQHECAAMLPKFDVLISPDKGATNKAKKHSQVTSGETKLVQLSKVRLDSGIVYEDFPYDTIKGTVCVVDDLIDKGGTFLALGKMIKRTQPNITSLNLYATHGLMGDGTTELFKFYDVIYVNNLMNRGLEYGDRLVHL